MADSISNKKRKSRGVSSFAAANEDRIAEAMSKVPLYHAAALREPRAGQWVVKEILPQGVTVMYGDSNTGKSLVALDIAIHVASGKPWLGKRTKSGTVLYVCAEGTVAFCGQRVPAAMRALDVIDRDLPLIVTPAPIFLYQPEPLEVLTDRILVEISERDSPPVRLVITDTLALNLEGDENASTDVGKFVTTQRRFAQRLTTDDFPASSLIVHHVGKNKAANERGSSALRASADCMILLTADKNEPRHLDLTIDKQREGGKGAIYGIKIVTTPLVKTDGLPLLDEDGEQEVTAVVQPRERSTPDSSQTPIDSATRALRAEILAYVKDHPACSQRDIRENVEGGNTAIKRVLEALVKRGRLRKVNRRGRGKGYAYLLPAPPVRFDLSKPETWPKGLNEPQDFGDKQWFGKALPRQAGASN